MKSRIINSFDDLLSVSRSHEEGHYIYRGENSVAYQLRPKFGRYNSCIRDDAIKIEKSMFNEFKRRGIPYLNNFPTDDFAWLALAQHYGLGTRLLDWSENLLVATFFALNNGDVGDRVIYAICSSHLDVLNRIIDPFNIDSVSIYRPKHVTNRISAQTGLFTVHPEPSKEFEHKKLEKWIIKNEAIINISVTLDGFGFNQSTMFPDLDGISQHINDWSLRGLRKL